MTVSSRFLRNRVFQRKSKIPIASYREARRREKLKDFLKVIDESFEPLLQ
jgi:hypothetical protein